MNDPVVKIALDHGYLFPEDVEECSRLDMLRFFSLGERLYLRGHLTPEQYMAILKEVKESMEGISPSKDPFSTASTLVIGPTPDPSAFSENVSSGATVSFSSLEGERENGPSSDIDSSCSTQIVEAPLTFPALSEEPLDSNIVPQAFSQEDSTCQTIIQRGEERKSELGEDDLSFLLSGPEISGVSRPSGLKADTFQQTAAKPAMEPWMKSERSSNKNRLGEYELVKELGQGGMGKVYLARHVTLDSLYALKVLKDRPSSSEMVRFQREAQVLAQLRHPNIVAIHYVGESQGIQYLVMDYVDGITLEKHFKEKKHSPKQALELVKKIADILSYAHEKGIVHRDIKPGNIMMDAQGKLMLMDFGLAKAITSQENLTQTGSIVGTPNYMAPEQAGGKNVDARSDIYALGAILYELLTGRPPFQDDNIYVLLLAICNKDPVPPRQINPQIAVDIESICLKSLEKEPGQRYESALALGLEIERYLNGELIQARPAGAWQKSVRWVRRNKSLSISLAGMLLLLASLTVFFVVSKIKDMQRIRELWTQAKIERDRAEKTMQTAIKERENAANYLRQFLASHQELTGVKKVHDLLEEAFRLMGGRAEIGRVLEKIEEATQTDPAYYGAWQARGRAFYHYAGRAGESEKAREYQNESIASFREALKRYPDDYISWIHLARVYTDLGNTEDSTECLEEVARIAPKNEYGAYGKGADILASLPERNAPDFLAKIQRARDFFQEALSFSPNFYLAHLGNGQCDMLEQKYEQAAFHFNQVLFLDPEEATGHFHLAQIAYLSQRYDLAMERVEKAIESRRGYAQAYYQKALIWDALGKADQAMSSISQALQINPHLPHFYEMRSRLGERKGLMLEAAEDMAKAAGLKPEDGVYAYRAASLLARAGHLRKSLEYLKQWKRTSQYSILLLKKDRTFDPLRKVPHYAKELEEIVGKR